MDPFKSIPFEILFILLFLVVAAFTAYAVWEISKFRRLSEEDKNNRKSVQGKELTHKNFVFARFGVITSIFLIFFVIAVISLFFTYPKMEYKYPEWDSYWRDYQRPIEVRFHRPIDPKTLELNISPETSGTWEFKKAIPFLPFVRTVKFHPDETVYPGNKVIVYFTHVTNFFNNHDNREEFLQFNSVDLPSVVSSSPENGAENVPIDQEVSFKLSHKEGEYVEWEFLLADKDDKFSVERNNSDVIKLKFEQPFKQNNSYTIKVNRIPVAHDTVTGERTKAGDPEEVYSLTFSTVNVPLVESMSPQGSNVLTNIPITVVFDNDMEQESVNNAFAIEPKAEGEKSWKDGRTFEFKPRGLSKGTKYTVKFPAGIKTVHGGQTEEEVAYSFNTIGHVRVAGWSPAPNSNGAKTNTPIKIIFDQDVDKRSAEAAFSLEPHVDGTFSWSGNNVMTYDPVVDLNHQTTFKVTIRAGVKTIYGLDSNQDHSMSFTTESKRVLISVPLYKQVNSKECQMVATRMLLGFKGIYKSNSQVFSEFPKQDVQCDATNNTWGNPNLGFVGKIDGNHDCASGNRGYGVYWNPVSGYLSSNGVSNTVKRGMSISQLTAEIEAGHPVMLWWQNGWSTPNDVSWNTPDGQYIYAVNGMHSEIAVGFIGSNDNPTHIITNDPWRGQRTLKIDYFKSLWSYFNNTGVVVY